MKIAGKVKKITLVCVKKSNILLRIKTIGLFVLLTVLLSLYAKLDVIVVLYSLRPVVHMLTLDIRLERNTNTLRF